MKPLRQTAATPSANPTPQPEVKAAKSAPVPLSQTALKQVAGGTGSTATPQRNW